jgi:hypothetical protein
MEDRTPLKRIGAETSKSVSCVSSNAFKALPPTLGFDPDLETSEQPSIAVTTDQCRKAFPFRL